MSTLQTSEKLIKKFDKLSAEMKDVLIMIAFIYRPINQTSVSNLVRALNWKTERGTQLASEINKPWRTKLLREGLLYQVEDNWFVVNPIICERLARKASNNQLGLDLSRVLQRVSLPIQFQSFSYSKREWQVRNFIYKNDHTELFKYLEIEPFSEITFEATDFLIQCCDFENKSDDNRAWFLNQSLAFQFHVLAPLLLEKSLNLIEADELYTLAQQCYLQNLQKIKKKEAVEAPMFAALLAQQALLRGKTDNLAPLLMHKNAWQLSISACYELYKGNVHDALVLFESALTMKRKETKKRKVRLFLFEQIMQMQALLVSGRGKDIIPMIDDRLKDTTFRSPWFKTLINLKKAAEMAQNIQGSKHEYPDYGNSLPLAELIKMYAQYWYADLTHLPENEADTELDAALIHAKAAGYVWFSHEAQHTLEMLGREFKEAVINTEFKPIMALLQPEPEWERALNALKNITDTNTRVKKATVNPSRMVWWIDPDDFSLAPREQKLGKSGKWSKGRAVSLKKLRNDTDMYDYLTPEDIKLCRCIEEYRGNGWYDSSFHELNEKALMMAVGHPRLYWQEDMSQEVSISLSQPELMVKEQGKSLTLNLEPFPVDNHEGSEAFKVGSHKIKLVKFDAEHLKIAAVLSEEGLTVPANAKAQVLNSISSIAPLLTVHSDIGGGHAVAREVDVDSRLYVQLEPLNDGLKLNALVYPLGEFGPAFKPGHGGKVVMSEVKGEQLQTHRNIDNERLFLSQLIDQCDDLYEDEHAEWLLEDPQSALSTLEYLQQQTDSDSVILVWPQGQSVKLKKTVDSQSMSLSVSSKKDWFALDGELQVDNEEVMSLSHLMALMQEAPGRFLKLDDGQYMALSQQLYNRLQSLQGISHAKNGKQQFHPLASQAIDEMTEGMHLTGSLPWKKQLTKLKEAYAMTPTVPSTVQADLRSYQLEGFEWLSRLAHWGAGACLADDMGLGKTLQALAMIVQRASQGPTLVLAPTSVCLNWMSEAKKFAPTLKVASFGQGNREKMLSEAGKFDLIICSYGLLQTEIEGLKVIEWSTVVADEAQAIKNPQAKRTQAAMALQADFKIITTGTPIENHLGELWSLFNFINPGLLGSLEEFNTHFATPIENEDEVASQQLRTLLKPFILRRLKTEVLTELPARTEININIEASADEKAFYEAARRQAVDSIESTDIENQGSKKLKILAEITRLRQVCCNPKLVMPDAPIGSAKLAEFERLVDELIENKHKALVFSQFVGHLALLKDALIKRGIEFQYLDGSTPMKKRQQAVNDFQSGKGDVFLISLKAGGSGLNLTAADYVIHMDPWWNPAVEDQASDRAHRMGQQRPVTIYRMIMENTIEEKILSLHAKKRDLATNLLEGSDKVSGKLDVDEMLALLN